MGWCPIDRTKEVGPIDRKVMFATSRMPKKICRFVNQTLL